MSKKQASPLAVSDDWQARSDMHTLKEAEQIKANDARLKAAQSHAAKELEMLAHVARGAKKARAKRIAKPARSADPNRKVKHLPLI